MPTSTDLEKKINLREAALRARAAETAAREAELQELKESLQKLQSARSDIRTAIEDAISDSPTINIEPTDWLEVAVEDFDSGPLTADEALRLALVSMRRQISSKDLVKWIIQSAVETSCLDAEGVIKAALETVRGTDLSVRDIVFVAMQAARNTPNISASEIVRPAVKISLELGNEIPVIIKDSFVAALRHNPSMLRSCLLSVLGCALGMGMTYRDIKDLMKAFSKEVKHGALDQRAADGESAQSISCITPYMRSLLQHVSLYTRTSVVPAQRDTDRACHRSRQEGSILPPWRDARSQRISARPIPEPAIAE